MDQQNKIVPVVTIVLYFGNEHWTAPKNIKDLLDIPDGLDEYVNDYNIHVFEIAWLTDEQIARFKSDFGIVARFFSERRKNPDYVPDDRTVITHVDAMLKILAVMARDRRYEEILKSDDKKEVGCMCDVAERLERKGIEKGIQKGRLSEIFDSVQSEDYSVERGAQKANMSIPEFEKAMEAAGYKIPTYA